jgi:uncharacterized membrane protein YoaK (UPF0700 family)
VTGVVDAVSYLGLGHVFTANVTGDIVILGFGLGGSPGLPVMAPLLALVAFIAGAAAAGVLAPRLSGRRALMLGTPLAIEAGLLAVAAGLAAAIHITPGRLSSYTVIVTLALAMGVRNATVKRIGVPDLTTTLLTLTISGLMADLAVGKRVGVVRRLGAVAAMLAGAIAGARLIQMSIGLALGAAAVLSALALAAWLHAARGE